VLVPAVALALPQGGQVTARSASIAHSGNTLTVTQTSGKTAIDWQGFSIGAGQSVKFRQPGAIITQGGVVLLSASAKAALLRTVVSETGLVEAGSAVSQRRTITLPGGASSTVAVSGALDAPSSSGAGWAVPVSGAHVVVAHRGRIVATGAIRGGTIAARGGALGGFVETSGASPRYLDVTGASVRTARS